MGIHSIKDLANSNFYDIKSKIGVLGAQLYAHAWGIDRTFLGEEYTPKSKSIGNSQVLIKDYTDREELEVVVREMGDQVATRLRKENKLTKCISLWVGYSLTYLDEDGKAGFSKQITVEATNSSKKIAEALLQIFDMFYHTQVVRNIGVTCSKLEFPILQQLNLFEPIETKERDHKFDEVVDTVRKKYGFKKLVYTSSLLDGGRAIARSSLVGGHAGGMDGIEDTSDE